VLYENTNGEPGNFGAGFRGLRSGGLAAISKAPALSRSQTMCSLAALSSSRSTGTSTASRTTTALAPWPRSVGVVTAPFLNEELRRKKFNIMFLDGIELSLRST